MTVTYADSVREELLAVPLKRPCCRRSLAMGLLMDAEVRDKHVEAVFRGRAVADAAGELFRRQYGKTAQVCNESAHGHSAFRLLFASSQAETYLLAVSNAGAGDSVLNGMIGTSCENCRSAFLRGVFLATATVSDPNRATHLEFLFRTSGRAALLCEYLTACGYRPGRVSRDAGEGLYFKNGNSVEELITLAGAGKSAMDMMNARIEREIRNQENRATNCVAKNIEKSVSATAKQMSAIEKLTLNGMLAQLPEPLRLTARLRAENPDASLEELRKLHDPPITKSGLNHRLKKLLEEAEK